MNDIVAKEKTVRDILSGKYSVDFYQREYKWGDKQVAELVDDLVGEFEPQWGVGHEAEKILELRGYFLGSIIVSERDGVRYIVDGQQRLTTLTLLLMSLRGRVDDARKGQLNRLICSVYLGKEQFNLDVPEREKCLKALYEGRRFDAKGQHESVLNLVGRYAKVDEMLGGLVMEQNGSVLPFPFSHFSDWLLYRVCLAEIKAASDEEAYTVFETMNDRGLSLTPTEMLKGYILSKIGNVETRNQVGGVWKKQVGLLVDYGKEEDADAVKAWLRGRHAQSIRDRKRNASPEDFDRIGSEFHRWVRDKEGELGLRTGRDFARFVERDLKFYSDWHLRLRRMSDDIAVARRDGLESVYYNAESKFTLQYPVLLSSLNVEDSDDIALPKLRAVSAYLDILIYRRVWSGRAIDYSTMAYGMFKHLMLLIRNMNARELAEFLEKQLAEPPMPAAPFSANPSFFLHGNNKPKVRRILARMTAHLEENTGVNPRYEEYVKHEVEHIWADKYKDKARGHNSEFESEVEFQGFRNRIGGLLLLPKRVNASLNDSTYEGKLEKYQRENLLAKSLHSNFYENNPAFLQFVRESGLPFKPHPEFKKSDLEERQALYVQLAERIWNPDRLRKLAAGG